MRHLSPLLVWAAAALACSADQPRSAPDTGVGLKASIVVVPFDVDEGARRAWPPRARAESLVAQFAHVPGVSARLGSSATNPTDFTLTGNVALKSDRLVVTTHLWLKRSDREVWTATFWRGTAEQGTLMRDIAVDALDGVYAALSRRTLNATKESR